MDFALPPGDELVTVGDAVADFLASCRMPNLSQARVRWHGVRLQRVVGYACDSPLSWLRPGELRSRLADFAAGTKPTTCNGYIRVKAFLNWALDEGLPLPINPRKLPKQKGPQRTIRLRPRREQAGGWAWDRGARRRIRRRLLVFAYWQVRRPRGHLTPCPLSQRGALGRGGSEGTQRNMQGSVGLVGVGFVRSLLGGPQASGTSPTAPPMAGAVPQVAEDCAEQFALTRLPLLSGREPIRVRHDPVCRPPHHLLRQT